jgi:hypothetical protein
VFAADTHQERPESKGAAALLRSLNSISASHASVAIRTATARTPTLVQILQHKPPGTDSGRIVAGRLIRIPLSSAAAEVPKTTETKLVPRSGRVGAQLTGIEESRGRPANRLSKRRPLPLFDEAASRFSTDGGEMVALDSRSLDLRFQAMPECASLFRERLGTARAAPSRLHGHLPACTCGSSLR